jgi:hypothetical protein
LLGGVELEKKFNEDDEARDYAAEEVRIYLIIISPLQSTGLSNF